MGLIEKMGSSFKAQIINFLKKHRSLRVLNLLWIIFQTNYPEFTSIWILISSSSNQIELLFFGFAYLNCSEFHISVHAGFIFTTADSLDKMNCSLVIVIAYCQSCHLVLEDERKLLLSTEVRELVFSEEDFSLDLKSKPNQTNLKV